MLLMTKRPFTTKQQRFIKLFNGNIAETCKMCEICLAYGNKLVNDSRIQKKLKERENNRNAKHIKTRQERQQFWSDKMDAAKKESDQLKASELLGRSEADFTDNTKITGDLTVEIVRFADEK